MATRAELERENAELRARLAELDPASTGRPGPVSFGMSEGVRAEIELAKADVAADPRVRERRVKDSGTGVVYVVARSGDDVTVTEHDERRADETATGRTDELPAE